LDPFLFESLKQELEQKIEDDAGAGTMKLTKKQERP
tara:strand:- start:96 stop:203 length:108 start_codon:yes stop_codon:yes gene_type:complete